MALNKAQLKSLENLHGISLKKLICIAKAAVKAYKCIRAAGGDPVKIGTCAGALVADIEKCLKGK